MFDLWTHRWRRTKATGDVIVIRYADDSIVGFQHEHEAKAFLHDLQERMRAFELALHPAKTRLIRFGRHAAKQREELEQLLARGMSNKEIARALEIAEATTKIHMVALLRALGARNRTEAAFKAGHLVNSTGLADAEGRPTVIKMDALNS